MKHHFKLIPGWSALSGGREGQFVKNFTSGGWNFSAVAGWGVARVDVYGSGIGYSVSGVGRFHTWSDDDKDDDDGYYERPEMPIPPNILRKMKRLLVEAKRINKEQESEKEAFKRAYSDPNYSMNPARRRKEKYRVRRNYKKYAKRTKASRRRVSRRGKR